VSRVFQQVHVRTVLHQLFIMYACKQSVKVMKHNNSEAGSWTNTIGRFSYTIIFQ
jgi:hypothetical protein